MLKQPLILNAFFCARTVNSFEFGSLGEVWLSDHFACLQVYRMKQSCVSWCLKLLTNRAYVSGSGLNVFSFVIVFVLFCFLLF